jgi:SAM-dependent methyltransferase
MVNANQANASRSQTMNNAYSDDQFLAVRRRIHDEYSVPRVNFAEWALSRVEWHGDEHVLDIGAGPGTYYDALAARIPNGQLVAGDLSLGMVRLAAERSKFGGVANADVQSLPFPRRTFDVVMANHMLYHVPDLDRALDEIHRVLKPTGLLIAATSSQYNLPELEQIIRRTFGLLGARTAELDGRPPARFFLEDGAMNLGRHFFAVARYDLPGAFVFSTPGPVIDYVNSMREQREPLLPRGISWDDFIAVLRDQLQRIIKHMGELVVSKLSGVIVATDAGGFANNYVNEFIISRRKK